MQEKICGCSADECAFCIRDKLVQIQAQVEYYFGDQNFIRDHYLREQMTPDGFVPLSVILEFPRMKRLHANADLVKQVF